MPKQSFYLFDTQTGRVMEYDTELAWCEAQLESWHRYIHVMKAHASTRCNRCYGRNYTGRFVDGPHAGKYEVCSRLNPQPFLKRRALEAWIERIQKEKESKNVD